MTCYLWLQIGESYYAVRWLEGGGVELLTRKGKRKPRWVSYHIHESQHGAQCDCPAFTFQADPDGCKHIKALRAVGLLGELA